MSSLLTAASGSGPDASVVVWQSTLPLAVVALCFVLLAVEWVFYGRHRRKK
jgi:hypothetical protein